MRVILPVEPPKTDNAEIPPVKFDATEVVAPLAVTVARVSVSAGGAELVHPVPSEVRMLPGGPGDTMGMLPDAVPTTLPVKGPTKLAAVTVPVAFTVPFTSNVDAGVVVPRPTFPALSSVISGVPLLSH
jgi:hypothetical protein